MYCKGMWTGTGLVSRSLFSMIFPSKSKRKIAVWLRESRTDYTTGSLAEPDCFFYFIFGQEEESLLFGHFMRGF